MSANTTETNPQTQADFDEQFAGIVGANFSGNTAAAPVEPKQKGVIRRAAEAYWAGFTHPEMTATQIRIGKAVGSAALKASGLVKFDKNNKMSLHKAGVEFAAAEPEAAAVMSLTAAAEEGMRQVLKKDTLHAYMTSVKTAVNHFRASGAPAPAAEAAPAAADFGPAAAATEQPASAMSEQRFVGRAAVPAANLAVPPPTMPERVARLPR